MQSSFPGFLYVGGAPRQITLDLGKCFAIYIDKIRASQT